MGFIKKIKNNDRLYCSVKLFKHRKDKTLRSILLSYFRNDEPLAWGLVNKEKYGNKKFLKINLSSEAETGAGFFALLRRTLESLFVADQLNLEPYVVWGSNVPYAEKHSVNGSENPFEYYFKQVTTSHFEDAYISIEGNQAFRLFWGKNSEVYDIDQDDIERLRNTYKQFIKLNEYTKKFIDDNLAILGGKKTLGVHVRGTDYWQLEAKHPNPITIDDYLNKCKELFATNRYEQIFIATDSLEAIKVFKDAFGDKIIYYQDVVRADGDVGVHLMKNEEDNHHYRLGLEVLRDAYTLANCDALVAGKSKVAEAARVIREKEFDDLVIIDRGTIKAE